MRFRDFISKPADAVKLVAERCQPFVAMNVEDPLLRGTGKGSSVRVEKVNKQRRPVDTEPHVHKAMDDWFERKFGARLRSEAVFCTSHFLQARSYGTVHCVFPVGKFKYFWAGGYSNNPMLKDRPLGDSLTLSTWIRDRARTKPVEDLPEITAYFLDKVTWKTTDMDRALAGGAEIMLLCDEVVLVNHEYLLEQYQSYQHFMKLVRGE
jgi:hypothetical protein